MIYKTKYVFLLKKAIFILSVLQIMFLTGCWNAREINSLGIAVCTGIDKTENGYLVTQQIVNPKAIASKRATNESPVVVYTETGNDIFEIFRKMTTESPRKVYVSHLRMVVFGEKLAKEGIQDIMDFFARDHEFRTDFNFIIAKDTTANSVLNILTPLESIPGIEMFDSIRMSQDSWAPTRTIRIIELMNNIISDGKNPVISGIEITSGASNSNSTDALRQSDQIKKLKYTYLGAFKKDKLVGWLDENESKGYNYITGNVKNTVGHLYYNDKVKITGEITDAKSEIKALLVNGQPAIEVELNIKENIGAVEGSLDVSKEESKIIIQKLADERAKEVCINALKKAQGELKTDIFGFGEAIHRKYPKLWEKIKADWNNEFTNIPVNIVVKTKIEKLGQVTKPFFIKEEK